MLKFKIIFFLIIFFGFFGMAKNSQAATINVVDSNGNSSCQQTDVQRWINDSNTHDGDTVQVPAGNCTWNNSLVITKGIVFKGAGADNTTITSNFNYIDGNTGAPYNFLLSFQPGSTELSANAPFRITGFHFDFNNKSGGIMLYNTTATVLSKIRIDHNIISNVYVLSMVGLRALHIKGAFYGVIDNNNFYGNRIGIGNDGVNATTWNNFIFNFGSSENMYAEDNTFAIWTTPVDAGLGGRYVDRYNTFTDTGTTGLYPWFDMHGNMGGKDSNGNTIGQNYGTMGAEIYGNVVNHSYTGAGVGIFDQRGGEALIFNNKAISTASCSEKTREEYDDALNPTTNPEPQKVSNSYYWNNRYGSTLISSTDVSEHHVASGGSSNTIECATCNWGSATFQGVPGIYLYSVRITSGAGAGQTRSIVGKPSSTSVAVSPNWDINPDNSSSFDIVYDYADIIQENRDYFNMNTAYNGTTQRGVYCGMTLPTACTTGDGAWITTQSCSSVDSANIGAHPITPISGTLYKCTTTNSWTAYYTPYTYPHPLRTDCADYPTLCDAQVADTTPPAAPSGLAVN